MPAGKVSQLLSSFMMRRLGSNALRFRAAVTLGFFIAAAGFAAFAPVTEPLRAQEGLFSFFFHDVEADQRAAPVAQRLRIHRLKARWRARRDGSGRRYPVAFGDSRQALCVRLCDGFSFPIGPYTGERGIDTQEAMCHSDCPDALTALYILPRGSDKITDARSARSSQNYSEIPDAMRYKAVLDSACTCHKADPLRRTMSVLHDLTLKRGDAIMTPDGVKVYHGGTSFPHQRSDFVALAQSPDIGQQERNTFKAMEDASRKVADAFRSVPGSLFAPDVPVTKPRGIKQANRN